MVKTKTDLLAEVAQLRDENGVLSRALSRADAGKRQMREERDALGVMLGEARVSLADLTEVNDNLTAALGKRASVPDLDAACLELGKLSLAVTFYRKLTRDGVRINRATDHAFLYAIGLEP